VLVEHRRAGIVPARRDRRRHCYDQRRRRSCLALGHPETATVASGCRSSGARALLAPDEDQAAPSNRTDAA
jgi:hypothetical protein